ncbi:hypothetical protein BD779DRAFT_1511383 [Infundibulicybe gibba]|nr:hypothetical protein BD779DRAFT_1511383 [Infundibulicybe gibba]
MSMKCSICLSGFREPVCLPCGHLYCTKCLSDHVNIPDSDDSYASCPTCRAAFNTGPFLTCLPKRYHQFIHPSVRRIYIDNSAAQALEQNLQAATAHAHDHITELLQEIQATKEEHMDLHKQHDNLQAKYSKMKKRLSLMQDQLKEYDDHAESANASHSVSAAGRYIVNLPRNSRGESSMSNTQSSHPSSSSSSPVQPGAKRKIRPLPKRDSNAAHISNSGMARHASPPLIPEDRIKRTRLAEDYSRTQRSK